MGTWPDGVRLTIYRETERTQEDDLIAGELHDPEAEELRADKQMAISQELYETTQRQISVPITDEAATLELPPSGDRANKFIACDADGNFIAATSVTGVPVTSFAETLLDDEDATEARATLGIEATGAEINLQCDKSANVKVLDEAGYTVLDDDGILWILVETGSSDRTITLPTAADNYKRVLHIIKTDPAGTGAVIVDGEGSETVNGYASITVRKSATVVCGYNGSAYCWQTLSDDGAEVGDFAFTAANVTAKTGYLYCDGTAVSRTTYARLFAKISTTWGQGDGSTTFNLPDFRGLFIRGRDGGAGRDPDAATRTAIATGGQTGDNAGSYQGSALWNHKHQCTPLRPTQRTGNTGATASSYWYGENDIAIDTTAPQANGAGTPTLTSENRGKNVCLNVFVKY